MAFIAKSAFEARITNNDRDNLANIAGKFFASDVAADCSAGMLCTRDSLLPNEGFTGVNNENTWKMVAATSSADADAPVYACNPYDWQLLAKGANVWAVGHETLGLGVNADRYGAFTVIKFDGQHVYRFGEGNVTINTTGDTFFTIANGLLTSVTAEPSTAGAIYFKLRGKGSFVEGNGLSFGYYDLEARKVTA